MACAHLEVLVVLEGLSRVQRQELERGGSVFKGLRVASVHTFVLGVGCEFGSCGHSVWPMNSVNDDAVRAVCPCYLGAANGPASPTSLLRMPAPDITAADSNCTLLKADTSSHTARTLTQHTLSHSTYSHTAHTLTYTCTHIAALQLYSSCNVI